MSRMSFSSEMTVISIHAIYLPENTGRSSNEHSILKIDL